MELLDSYWGGLGDWLSISTLPEEFTKQKGIDVYLNSGASFRNEGIKELFLLNPFIKGLKAGRATIGNIPLPDRIMYNNFVGVFIKNWEISHGLEGKNDFPKIYYTPEKKSGYENVLLVDMSTITATYDPVVLCDILNSIRGNWDLLSVNFSQKLNSPENDIFHNGRHEYYDFGISKININSIFEYCDLISSVGGYISLHSGGHSLAAAIRNQFHPELKQMCISGYYHYKNHEQQCMHLYSGVDYLTFKEQEVL